jgi:hypothetical protein
MITKIDMPHKQMSLLMDMKSFQYVFAFMSIPLEKYMQISNAFGVDICVSNELYKSDGFYAIIESRIKNDLINSYSEILYDYTNKFYGI